MAKIKQIISISLLLLTFSVNAHDIVLGAERTDAYLSLLEGKKIGIVGNQTSMIVNTHLVDSLIKAYKQVRIGDPLDSKTLMGPLIDQSAIKDYLSALKKVKTEGGEILYGGNVIEGSGTFVEPTIVRAENHYQIVQDETFAPILYVMKYDELDEAIKLHNSVPQGLSSSILDRKSVV